MCLFIIESPSRIGIENPSRIDMDQMEKNNKVLEYLCHERRTCYYISNFLTMPLKWVFYFSFKGGKT